MHSSPSPDPDAPVLLVAWEEALGRVLDRTADFPKAHRHTFGLRLENLALDVHGALVRARWSSLPSKRGHLQDADMHLAVLRAVLRLAYERRFIARAPYEQLVRDLDDAGRQLGGWRRAIG